MAGIIGWRARRINHRGTEDTEEVHTEEGSPCRDEMPNFLGEACGNSPLQALRASSRQRDPLPCAPPLCSLCLCGSNKKNPREASRGFFFRRATRASPLLLVGCRLHALGDREELLLG